MNELDKLRAMLDAENIPYESIVEKWADNEWFSKVADSMKKVMPMYGEAGQYIRNQIIYGQTGKNEWKFDGICQYGSYGAAEGLIETYGQLGWDKEHNPRVLTAQEAFDIIKGDYDANH